MVRNYKKKKEKPPPTDIQIIGALVTLKISGKSFREVALTSGIPKATLHNYAKRFKDCSNLPPDTKIKPTFYHLQVLIPTREQELTDYLIESQLRSHGLTSKSLKKLIYSFANIFNAIPVPPSWVKRQTAGKDWFTNFLKRIRKPEATSQARAAALNKVVMNKFYDQVTYIWLYLFSSLSITKMFCR